MLPQPKAKERGLRIGQSMKSIKEGEVKEKQLMIIHSHNQKPRREG